MLQQCTAARLRHARILRSPENFWYFNTIRLSVPLFYVEFFQAFVVCSYCKVLTKCRKLKQKRLILTLVLFWYSPIQLLIWCRPYLVVRMITCLQHKFKRMEAVAPITYYCLALLYKLLLISNEELQVILTAHVGCEGCWHRVNRHTSILEQL